MRRGAVSKVTTADGTHFFTIVPDPVEPKSPELYRLRVQTGETAPGLPGPEIGRLDVILQPNAWRLGLNNLGLDGVIGDLADLTNMSGRSSLPILIQGTRLIVTGQLSELQRDILCAVCVDLAIGHRPYVTAMR